MCYNIYTLQLKMISKILTSLPDALKDRLFPTIATKKVNGKFMFAFHRPGGVWRLFDSFSSLQKYLRDDEKTWCFEAETEEELEKYEPHDFAREAACGWLAWNRQREAAEDLRDPKNLADLHSLKEEAKTIIRRLAREA